MAEEKLENRSRVSFKSWCVLLFKQESQSFVFFCGIIWHLWRKYSPRKPRIQGYSKTKDGDAVTSQQLAATSLLAFADLQRRSGGHLKHLPHAVLGLGGTLQVAEGTDAVGHVSGLVGLHWLLERVEETGGKNQAGGIKPMAGQTDRQKNRPVSSWPAPCACAHRYEDPFCCPQEWWGHWDKSVSLRGSISLECSLREQKYKTQITDLTHKDWRKRGQLSETSGIPCDYSEVNREGADPSLINGQHLSW